MNVKYSAMALLACAFFICEFIQAPELSDEPLIATLAGESADDVVVPPDGNGYACTRKASSCEKTCVAATCEFDHQQHYVTSPRCINRAPYEKGTIEEDVYKCKWQDTPTGLPKPNCDYTIYRCKNKNGMGCWPNPKHKKETVNGITKWVYANPKCIETQCTVDLILVHIWYNSCK